MEELTRIAVLGRDGRQTVLGEELRRFYGKKSVPVWDSIEDYRKSENKGADYVVFPAAGPDIATADQADGFYGWMRELDKRTRILTGLLPETLQEACKTNGISVRSYLKRPEFQIANAAITAEGAIRLCMEQTGETIAGARVLILGFGRCGMALALRMSALGARVVVFARKLTDRELGRSLGLDMRPYEELSKLLRQKAWIFNTVPAMMLDRERIAHTAKGSRVIDLASAPGGTDFAACRERGIEAVLAASLPGKYFPITAGKLLANTVLQMVEEDRQKEFCGPARKGAQ